MTSWMPELRIDVAEADALPEEIELAARSLRASLLELDVENVRPVPAGPAPAGTKAGGVDSIGAMIVTLIQSPELLGAIATVVAAWIGARSQRSVKLTIDGDVLEMTGGSAHERRAVVEDWFEQHRSGRE